MKRLLLSAALLLLSVSVSAQGEMLRLNLKKGSVIDQKMKVESDISQNVFGQQIDMDMVMDAGFRYKVQDIEDGNFVFETTYTGFGLSMKSPAAQMDLTGDSGDTGTGNIISEMLATMVDKPFTITMSPAGRTLSVEGLGSVFSEMSQIEATASLTPEQVEQMSGQIRSSFDAQAMKDNMEMGMAMFPDTPVSVGDSWRVETSVAGGMPVEVSATYTLVEKNRDYLLVRGEAVIEPTGSVLEQGGISMKVDLGGTMTMELKLDPKTLWTTHSQIDMLMEGNMVLPKSEQIPMDMTIPMTIGMKIEIEPANP